MRKCFRPVLSVIAGSVDAISFLGLGGLFTAPRHGQSCHPCRASCHWQWRACSRDTRGPVFVTALGLTRLLAGALESAGFALATTTLLLQLLLLSGFFVLCASAGRLYGPGPQRRRLSRACSASRRWPCKTHSYRYR